MLRSNARAALKFSLQVLSKSLWLVGGLSFLIGGRLIHEIWNIDRVLAEVMGIGFAVVCFFLGYIAKSAVEDLDWEEANERAEREASAAEGKPKA